LGKAAGFYYLMATGSSFSSSLGSSIGIYTGSSSFWIGSGGDSTNFGSG
jgi:hypothetical protein